MELKKLFRFRNIWIGAAMLWIVFFHSNPALEAPLLLAVKNLGYGGVDICLFASGIGCYYSLEKDPDILLFLNRRVKRLSPAYFCFIIPWLLWRMTVSDIPAKAIVGNLLGIQTLISWDYHFNWYITGLLVFYFSLPYLKRITDTRKNFRQDIFVAVCLWAIGIPFWGNMKALMLLSRLPVLYAGIVCAKLAKQCYVLKTRDYWFQGILVLTGVAVRLIVSKCYPDLLRNCGMYWYPFVLIAPGCCIFISWLAEKTEKSPLFQWFNKLVGIVGVYSFEVYLVHLFLYEGLMPDILEHFYWISPILLWLLTIPVIICGTFLLNRAASFATRLTETKKHGQ